MKRRMVLLAGLVLTLIGFRSFGAEGYVLNMYHFNLQYVAGDEKAMWEGLQKGLEPLLDIYLAHPDWKADFEMQAEFITYMAEKDPIALEKLRKLAKNGQAEVVSFHYSDQLLLAFPALDQERSLKLTQEIFKQYDIPLSPVIFAQEAQFGEGMCALGKKWGYKIGVMTPGPYNHFQDDPGIPFFSCRGIYVLKAENPDVPPEKIQSEEWAGVKVKWYFLGDGELVVTGGISPYFSGLFQVNKARVKKMEDDFRKLQEQGYKIATVSEYVEALERNKVKPRALKPILDAPWRPEDDKGVFTWMGHYVLPWEDDYGIRTQNWQTRSWLLSAEKAGVSWEDLRSAWKNQLDAEVSDSTGWFPFKVELNYSRSKSQAVIDEVKRLCPNCQPEEMKLALEQIAEKDFPVSAKIIGAKKAEAKFFQVKDHQGLFALEARFIAGSDSKLAFPFTGSAIVYSPAMLENELVRIPLNEIKHNLHYVGLPNGLIALDDSVWLIRDNKAGTVACGIDPDNKEIHFRVKGAKGREIFFRIFIFKGSEKDALLFANQLNETNG